MDDNHDKNPKPNDKPLVKCDHDFDLFNLAKDFDLEKSLRKHDFDPFKA